jgi:hypothetical protein
MMEPKEEQASGTTGIDAMDSTDPLLPTTDQDRISARWAAIQSAFREVRRLSLAHRQSRSRDSSPNY